MFQLQNTLDEDSDENELENGDLIWYLDDSMEEFWEHPVNPQFLFYCGPKTIGGEVSKIATVNRAIAVELPEYVWYVTYDVNKCAFYRKEAETILGKSLTFNEAVDMVATLMEDIGIQKYDP